jgi:hypothetical protein
MGLLSLIVVIFFGENSPFKHLILLPMRLNQLTNQPALQKCTKFNFNITQHETS